ncbi:hypothetical protein Tco_0584199 [Tanacetum coccineum]
MKEESIGWFGSRSVTVTYTMSQVLTEAASIRFGLWTITGSILSSTLVIVNGVRFVVHSRDERRTTQNSGICSPGLERRNMVTHIDVDAPPDIIDIVDEDDDIIDKEDPVPHDLADSDDEDLVNLDIDDGVNMSDDVARGYGGDGGGDDRPPPYQVRAPESPIWGWQEAGRPQYRQEIPETWVKGITDKSGPSRIGLRPVDLRPHSGIRPLATNLCGHPATLQIDLQKMARRLLSKERYWVTDEDGTYDLVRPQTRTSHAHCCQNDWDAQLVFWNDPKNLARAAQNKQNRAKSKVMETSATREYPSLIHTFFLTHTVGGVFLNPEDKALYDEMLRLQGLGSNTPTGVPYTEDEIMAIVRGGKQRGHIPGVGRVLPGQGTVIPPPSQSTHSTDIARLKKREKQLTKQVNMFMRLFRSDDKFSQMLNQFESQPEYGGGSGSGGCGDDEPGDDEDGGEDEDDS